MTTNNKPLEMLLIANTVLESSWADLRFCLLMETKYQVCASKSFTLTIFTLQLNKKASGIFILPARYDVNTYILAELGLSGFRQEHVEENFKFGVRQGR